MKKLYKQSFLPLY